MTGTARHVLLAGGGTAGHVEPALALADALRRRDPQILVTVLGTRRGLEARLVPARGYRLELIPPVPIPRRPSTRMLTVPARLRAAVHAVERVLDETDTDVLAGFGGYVAGPAYLAARSRKVPYVVHEANARPGLANRLGARSTPYVATATKNSSLPHAVYVGMPLREAIATLDRSATRATARQSFGLAGDRPTLLVFGGSQGARRLNDVVAGSMKDFEAAGVQVLHAAGPAAGADKVDPVDPVDIAAGFAGYVRTSYIDRMDLAYAAADLSLCRAGAMTCAELAAVGLPAAYVPLPIGNGEQRLNAGPVVQAGGGLLVEDARCTPEWVRSVLIPLLVNPDRLRVMGTKAATFGTRDGADRLADMVLLAAGQNGPDA